MVFLYLQAANNFDTPHSNNANFHDDEITQHCLSSSNRISRNNNNKAASLRVFQCWRHRTECKGLSICLFSNQVKSSKEQTIAALCLAYCNHPTIQLGCISVMFAVSSSISPLLAFLPPFLNMFKKLVVIQKYIHTSP